MTSNFSPFSRYSRKELEDVVTHELGVAGIETVQFGVLAGDVQRILGEIDVDYLPGTALEA